MMYCVLVSYVFLLRLWVVLVFSSYVWRVIRALVLWCSYVWWFICVFVLYLCSQAMFRVLSVFLCYTCVLQLYVFSCYICVLKLYLACGLCSCVILVFYHIFVLRDLVLWAQCYTRDGNQVVLYLPLSYTFFLNTVLSRFSYCLSVFVCFPSTCVKRRPAFNILYTVVVLRICVPLVLCVVLEICVALVMCWFTSVSVIKRICESLNHFVCESFYKYISKHL